MSTAMYGAGSTGIERCGGAPQAYPNNNAVPRIDMTMAKCCLDDKNRERKQEEDKGIDWSAQG
jgi:hypothetical protein